MAVCSNDSGEISASNDGMTLIAENYERVSRLERFLLEQVGYLLPAPAATKKSW